MFWPSIFETEHWATFPSDCLSGLWFSEGEETVNINRTGCFDCFYGDIYLVYTVSVWWHFYSKWICCMSIRSIGVKPIYLKISLSLSELTLIDWLDLNVTLSLIDWYIIIFTPNLDTGILYREGGLPSVNSTVQNLLNRFIIGMHACISIDIQPYRTLPRSNNNTPAWLFYTYMYVCMRYRMGVIDMTQNFEYIHSFAINQPNDSTALSLLQAMYWLINSGVCKRKSTSVCLSWSGGTV